jgi:hypothetical protein
VRLNGWQRLWVFVSVPCVLFFGFLIAAFWIESGAKGLSTLGWVVMFLGVFLPAILYGVGVAVAWVIQGFRANREAGR